jgi:hypothetical protein
MRIIVSLVALDGTADAALATLSVKTRKRKSQRKKINLAKK